MQPIALNGTRETLDAFEWAVHFTWEVPLILWHRPHFTFTVYCIDFHECTIERAAEHVSWANCNTVNILPIALNGSKKALASCTRYTRMGPTFRLRGTTDPIVRAASSFEAILSIASLVRAAERVS